jgi:serine/threonine protein kinase/Tol biopolymer transport system component
MTLAAGTKLGPYEIAAPLGAGGMGEVYRARDTKLNREVALKVLPESMASDPQRMARFEREARTLASLNHPNIAAIYGLETSNGTTALVMELVEGETLEERIARSSNSHTSKSGGRKGLQPEDSLQIARQIAEALEYAHERGVIHRDLKPANVKITPEGAAKVLDFGLAKVLSNDSSASMDPSNSPTISVMATQMGIILGTAAYMAPEQAKGKQVDRRADIWAFGCVLYEMLTGKKPFEGETISDILAAVIRAEPDWSLLPETTPPSMKRLIRRCLEKDAKQRLQAIGEARIAIEKLLAGDLTEESIDRPEAVGKKPRLHHALPWALAGFFAVAFVTALVLWKLVASAPNLSPVLSYVPPPPQTVFKLGPLNAGPVEVSPNGRQLAFSATDEKGVTMLWVRALASNEARAIAGTEDAGALFWSPDSDSVGFIADGKLKTVNVDNGTVQVLADASQTYCPTGGAWSSGGMILFRPKACLGPLNEIPASGGKPTPVTKLERGEGYLHAMPAFLPDGRHFLYESTGTSTSIWMSSLGSDERKLVLKGASDPQFASGHLLFERGNHVFAQPFDAATGKLTGEAVALADGQSFSVSKWVLATQKGVLVTYGRAATAQLEWFDRNGNRLGILGPVAHYFLSRISPDGKRVLADVEDPQSGSSDYWSYPAESGPGTRLTFGPGFKAFSVWSPDGKYIAYPCQPNGKPAICRKPADGSGAEEPVFTFDSSAKDGPTPGGPVVDWSPDGRYIIFDALDKKDLLKGNQHNSIWVLPLSGNRKPFLVAASQAPEFQGSFSPDGRWLAYFSYESGGFGLYVVSFPGPGGKYQISQNSGGGAVWDKKGHLYFLSMANRLMEADLKTSGTSLQVKAIDPLFQLHAGSLITDVSPDGSRFLVVTSTDPSALQSIELLLNWQALLKK